ncbi:MAG: helix-turn-helix transcriptional regulator [Clostridium sp.]|nr:helix-turn-helix transcriptional regulator [Clostridium sp.]
MSLGNNISKARKRSGMSQEVVAEKLGVSRQTISKWESNETIPDIYQCKKLAKLYHLTLDELIEFDIDLQEIQEVIDNTDEKINSKVNWTKAWSKKYPILATYHKEVDILKFSSQIRIMLEDLKREYNYTEIDAVLVLKDILAHEMKR